MDLFKKGEKYSFFNPKNALFGLIWADITLLIFFSLAELDYYLHRFVYIQTDITRPIPPYVFWISFVTFILPLIITGKNWGKKNALSLLVYEILFIFLIVSFLVIV
ncbi:MAG: hypothetical protein WD712_01895 [Candidatus Spechtbacterales bacterium]